MKVKGLAFTCALAATAGALITGVASPPMADAAPPPPKVKYAFAALVGMGYDGYLSAQVCDRTKAGTRFRFVGTSFDRNRKRAQRTFVARSGPSGCARIVGKPIPFNGTWARGSSRISLKVTNLTTKRSRTIRNVPFRST